MLFVKCTPTSTSSLPYKDYRLRVTFQCACHAHLQPTWTTDHAVDMHHSYSCCDEVAKYYILHHRRVSSRMRFNIAARWKKVQQPQLFPSKRCRLLACSSTTPIEKCMSILIIGATSQSKLTTTTKSHHASIRVVVRRSPSTMCLLKYTLAMTINGFHGNAEPGCVDFLHQTEQEKLWVVLHKKWTSPHHSGIRELPTSLWIWIVAAAFKLLVELNK